MNPTRKITFCFIFAFIGSTISFAQIEGWESQESSTDAWLNDVFFINSDTGWVAGNSVLLNTTNGGINWTVQDSTNANFASVWFTDSNHGWAVGYKDYGYNGFIYHTENGGQHWYLRDSSQFDLSDICFINPDTGYAVGGARSSTTLLRTTNAGTTWEPMDAYGGHLYTIQFVNDTVGWAAGNQGCVLKTEDGGSSWSTIYLDVGMFNLVSVSFINQDTGWVVGNDKIYNTTNGGETWEAQEWQSNHYYRSCYFKDFNSGWLATSEGFDTGKIIYSEDGGISWSVQNLMENRFIQSLFFIDDKTAWGVGSSGTILKTTSGGLVSIRDQGTSKDELTLENGLHQNFPNPFSIETTISYKLPVSGQVRLIVYNHQGQEVATLVNTKQSAGNYEINFEGSELASGVYFYKLDHAGGISVKKMQLIR